MRLIAYGVLAPSCLMLGLDRWNRGRRKGGRLYMLLGGLFLSLLVTNVLDLVGVEREVVLMSRAVGAVVALVVSLFAALLVLDVLRGIGE